MMPRAIRSALRRIGIRLPFTAVICPEWNKSIRIESDWRARVTTSRTLVFTEMPRPGDLHDGFPIEPGSPLEILFYDSPDAVEVGRTKRDAHTLTIDWLPKDPVTRYALYHHEDSWIHPVSHKHSAVAAHYRCDMKTGVFGIDFLTPGSFEAGVGFRRPRWRYFRTERSLMKYALTEMRTEQAAHPRLDDGGKRASWRIDGPKRGDGFVFVLFHEHGVLEWERRLRETSLAGRARRFFSQLAHPARS
jgi:hypothetical protein